MRYAARRLGLDAKNIAVVGDDPALEIAMAHKGKAFAIGVNSGLGDVDIFRQMDKNDRPHLVVDDLAELSRLYRPA
jgi:NagD protein